MLAPEEEISEGERPVQCEQREAAAWRDSEVE